MRGEACADIGAHAMQVLDLEEQGNLNLTLRLKKKALQGAYDNAIKKKKARSPTA